MFGLRTLSKKKIEGRFYASEIRKVGVHDTRGQLKIKAILNEKTKNGKVFSLVQYEQLPDKKYWTWIEKNKILSQKS